MSDEEYAPLPFTPLIIIGAGRSGTNALRDALTRLQDFETWPCDEINPIWRHGNLDLPTDEIPPERATPVVRQAIRSSFYRIWQKQGCPRFVVEKTCANTLRVPFVDAVLPEALYIHIVRNGFDIIVSARKRWRGELEVPSLSYYAAKARYAPLSDLPRYAVSALRNRLAIRFGRQEHFDSWGPRFSELGSLSGAPLDEIVARQWAACVTSSDAAFAQIMDSRVYQMRYEDFTNNPADSLADITKWLGVAARQTQLIEATSSITASSVGKGLAASETLPEKIKSLLAPSMRAHGYQE
ncbi:sulfotransferase [Sulfitobacter sp. M39]|uniref:sulfotransferase family protein n=1 Tax=Sulfitobacter sp. M39 TaxID=2675334 RepID=UPI001F97C9F7|nr:sulfotransferase [Sulfitobacter sp. M39]